VLLQVGGGVSVVIGILFGLRALLNLWRTLVRRTVTLRIFDKGFVWVSSKREDKYGWSQLVSYREGGRGLYLGERPIVQWGADRLQMSDGRVFKITGVYGDFREISRILRRIAAHFTGIQMGRWLRDEKPVKLHPKLVIWPGGVEAGKQEIPWSQVEVRLRNRHLEILRRSDSGKFKTVRGYNARQVDNVGGFLELATATIRNHQRERFEKK
jgi:hypothetical protein